MIAARRAAWRPAGQAGLLLGANLLLLAPPGSAWRVAGGLLLTGLLPGLAWATLLLPGRRPLSHLLFGAGLSYTLTSLLSLGLHYATRPGPIHTWQLLLALNGAAAVALLWPARPGDPPEQPAPPVADVGQTARRHWPFLAVLLLALVLRAASLSYSEFQGDEALAMISAAEALSGHEDALFLRGKGPGEVLLPLALWRLSGLITESTARLPFTLASLLGLVTLYELAGRLFNRPVAVAAAAVFASNGFMVGFGRIVQYQALVVWLSALALLCAWRWRESGRVRWLALSGLFLGTGLLAHYDAILVAPAILYVGWLARSGPAGRFPWRAGLVWGAALLAAALPFYLPYTLDPQAGRTGEYLGQRLGAALLKNNLADFFHFTTFYSSFYYLAVTGLLIAGFLAWALHRWPRGRFWAPALAVLAIAAAAFFPAAFRAGATDWAALPLGLALLAAFLSPALGGPERAALVWLAVPFLGYNFAVARPLTHFYTSAPGWALLAGLAVGPLFARARPAVIAAGGLLLVIQSIYLGNAFLRQDREFWQDYPAGRLAFFWSPYAELPPAGFFGFVHRSGWKAVGQELVAGGLAGDYGSNEEPEVTTWYTRGAPRACDPQPEFYFLADDLIDPVAVPLETIEAGYAEVGRVRLANGKGLSIRQRRPAGPDLGRLDEAALARAFDRSATPEAFARSARGAVEVSANFGGLVRLVGYDLNLDRAYPGGRLPVTLYWQPLGPIPASYHVFTHLEGDRLYAQADGVPVCWTYPTDVWRPGQIIADQHSIDLPADLPPGGYPLAVGLYLPEGDLPRLDLLDEAGNPAGTSLQLTTVEIKP